MHRSETQLAGPCSDCGTAIRPTEERTFRFGARGVLCCDCALRRGGSYDETRDRWTEEPRTDDLGRAFD